MKSLDRRNWYAYRISESVLFDISIVVRYDISCAVRIVGFLWERVK